MAGAADDEGCVLDKHEGARGQAVAAVLTDADNGQPARGHVMSPSKGLSLASVAAVAAKGGFAHDVAMADENSMGAAAGRRNVG